MTIKPTSKENNVLKSYNMLLYFAGSMIMYEPSEECIVDFWTQGKLKNLPVSSSNPNFIKAISQLRESCVDQSACVKQMKEDYVRLFSKQNLSLAPAFKSHYIKSSDSNKTIPSVTEFYNSYGWESRFRNRISDGHISIKLLFLTLLVDKYLDLDDAVCIIEMRGEIRRFINNHILSWIMEWNDKIQQNAKTICYKGIGSLILASVEDIFNYLEQNVSLKQNEGIKN